MSFLDEKSLDIILEDSSSFGYRLTFIHVTQECQEHPVTGAAINCKDVDTPVDLAPLTFTGDISQSLDDGSPVIESFNFQVISEVGGVIEMRLSVAEIEALVPLASTTRDKYNPRYRFLGYYDVLSTENGGGATRVMQGKVYISDGVTD